MIGSVKFFLVESVTWLYLVTQNYCYSEFDNFSSTQSPVLHSTLIILIEISITVITEAAYTKKNSVHDSILFLLINSVKWLILWYTCNQKLCSFSRFIFLKKINAISCKGVIWSKNYAYRTHCIMLPFEWFTQFLYV